MTVKNICQNKKARHEYHIEDTYETGIVLTGTEVKSLRVGRGNLLDSYARVENGEMMLYNMHISPYEQGNRYNHEPKRTRKLLMHKSEIMRLFGRVREKGYSLIPTRAYFRDGKVKVELGLAKGKKTFDKRQDLAARDARREVDRAFRDRQKQ
ncbi:SsrA-binding protein [Desulfofarcimen acetoxidans DSM 771]|uniref:SsrA-binding protein n=1 Tax=Desulfofarcimen acetoxidans (strain ATCC 49208 / DSM 771 / KCTC 5769 / VKM B-1644 / 5575) TaxID=485916 RepID=C8VXZ3_DESAS|nr:SsrA-binding protein SmpB [Desulfofarcimen acetoxidans]ACV64622.1 SsrA-binding protein [Desulfofarcimen acetoxidans DSM 771]